MENKLGMPILADNFEGVLSNSALSNCEKAGKFKYVASMALKLFKVPVALVVFVDKELVLKLSTGPTGRTDIMSKLSHLNSLAILKEDLLFPEFTREETFLLANRLVATGFGFLFFASAPLKIREGESIGTICILDKKQREFSESDQYLLEGLASFVVEETRRRQGKIEEFQL